MKERQMNLVRAINQLGMLIAHHKLQLDEPELIQLEEDVRKALITVKAAAHRAPVAG